MKQLSLSIAILTFVMVSCSTGPNKTTGIENRAPSSTNNDYTFETFYQTYMNDGFESIVYCMRDSQILNTTPEGCTYLGEFLVSGKLTSNIQERRQFASDLVRDTHKFRGDEMKLPLNDHILPILSSSPSMKIYWYTCMFEGNVAVIDASSISDDDEIKYAGRILKCPKTKTKQTK